MSSFSFSDLGDSLQEAGTRFRDFLREANPWPLSLFFTVFTAGLIFRGRMYYALTLDDTAMVPPEVGIFGMFQFVNRELIFALIVLTFSIPLAILLGFLVERYFERLKPVLKWPGYILLSTLVMLLALLYVVHHGLVFSVRSGLTLDMILEVLSAHATVAMTGDIVPGDYIFMGVVTLVFWLFLWTPTRLVGIRNLLMLPLILAVFILAQAQDSSLNHKISRAIKSNPVVFTLGDVVRTLRANAEHAKLAEPPTGQLHSVAFVPPRYALGPTPQPTVFHRKKSKWNLLFIIMESTGSDYIFDTTHGNEIPMPYLKKLSQESLYMKDHYSPANTTPRGSFSIFSGLFPAPRVDMFVTRKDVYLPSLNQYMERDYDSFYVYNGSLDWFFPRYFLRNSGFDTYGMYSTDIKRWKPGPQNGRYEPQLVDFFLRRLDKAGKRNFVGVYHSYVAHWPYHDYGPKYNIFPPGKHSMTSGWQYKYYNNLRMMDMQIERIFAHLKKRGILKDTVVVITGDHGQAFGQHRGNWIHSRYSYRENFRVPLIIYQPALFEPRIIEKRTMHVDILPTLLEKLRVAYNPGLLQGENILNEAYRRKYDFLYGNEKTVSSISRNNINVQFSFKTNKCQAFDLNLDREQQNPMSCDKFPEQKDDLLSYNIFQNRTLDAYNQAMLDGKPFFGQQPIYHGDVNLDPFLAAKQIRSGLKPARPEPVLNPYPDDNRLKDQEGEDEIAGPAEKNKKNRKLSGEETKKKKSVGAQGGVSGESKPSKGKIIKRPNNKPGAQGPGAAGSDKST